MEYYVRGKLKFLDSQLAIEYQLAWVREKRGVLIEYKISEEKDRLSYYASPEYYLLEKADMIKNMVQRNIGILIVDKNKTNYALGKAWYNFCLQNNVTNTQEKNLLSNALDNKDKLNKLVELFDKYYKQPKEKTKKILLNSEGKPMKYTKNFFVVDNKVREYSAERAYNLFIVNPFWFKINNV